MSTGTFKQDLSETRESRKAAKEWCEKARNLLRIKKGLLSKDEKTFDSRELTRAIESVEQSLDKLEKLAVSKKTIGSDQLKSQLFFDKFKRFSGQFKDISKQAEKAISESNMALATTLASQLNILDQRIKLECGEINQEQFNKAEFERIEELRQRYYKLISAAKSKLEELESFAEDEHEFVGDVAKIIYNAEIILDFDDAQLFTGCIETLGKVDAEYDKQIKIHDKFLQYQQEYLKAEGLLEKTTWANNQHTSQIAFDMEELIDDSEESATRFNYDLAIQQAKDAQNKFASGIKKLPSPVQKSIVGLIKAKDEYFKKRKTKIDSIHELEGMRIGSFDSQIASFTEIAQKTIDEGDEIVGTSTDLTEITTATKKLDSIDEFLERGKKYVIQAKEKHKQNLEHAKQWAKLSLELKQGYTQILNLPGVDELRGQYSLELTKANEFAKNDEYADACASAKKCLEILNSAISKSDEIMKETLVPLLQTAVNKARVACRDYQKIGLEFQSQANFTNLNQLEAEAKIAYSNADKDPNKSVPETIDSSAKTINSFTESVRNEIEELKILKDLAQQKQTKFDNVVQKLQSLGFPEPLESGAIELGNRAKTEDFSDQNWSGAIDKLDTVITRLDTVANEYEQLGPQWKERQNKITQMREFLKPFQNWPLKTKDLWKFNEDLREVESVHVNSSNLSDPINEYDTRKIDEQYSKLKQVFDKIDQNALSKYQEAMDRANQEVVDASGKFGANLYKITSRLTGTISKTTEFEESREKIWDEWREFRANPTSKDPTCLDVTVIEKEKSTAIKAYSQLDQRLSSIANDESALEDYVDKFKKQDLDRNLEQLPNMIRELLDMVEHLGEDVKTKRKELSTLSKDQPIAKPNQEKLKKLYQDMDKLLKLVRARQQSKVKEATTRLAENRGKIENAKIKNDYKAYRDQLVDQASDIESMIESGDPYLLEIAVQQEQELMKKYEQLTDENASVTYDDADKLIKQLSSDCGRKKVMKMLPETYKRNYEMLLKAISSARQTSPAQAVEILSAKDLTDPIAQAITDAEKLEDEHRKFSTEKKNLESRWKGIKKQTGTKWGNKANAVNKYFESRLNDADTVRKGEGGLPQAFEILEKMKQLVDDIDEEPDSQSKRDKLQTYNVKYEQEARELRDLAKQFEADRDAFKNVTLKKAREELDLPRTFKNVVTKKHAENIDTLNGLEKVVDTAAKLVAPYLKTIKTIKIGADSAPDLEKAKAKFESARTQVANAEQTVKRLLSGGLSTNVIIQEDFTKVQKAWQEQSRLYAAEIKKLIAAIQEIPNEDLPEKDSKQCVNTLEKIATHFRTDAFAKPFGTLMQPAPKKKDELVKQQKAKLAAREQALRTMRELRDDLLNHPTITALGTKQKNKVSGQEMLAVSGSIRVALKRIEIETLIGV